MQVFRPHERSRRDTRQRLSTKERFVFYAKGVPSASGTDVHHSWRGIGRVGRYIVVVALLIFIGWCLTLQKGAIVHLSSATAPRSAAEYQGYIDSVSSRNPLNRFRLTFQKSAMQRDIQSHFPEVLSANIVMPFGGRMPSFYLTVDSAALILKTSNGSYVVSRNGRVLGDGNSSIDVSKLIVVDDQSGIPIQGDVAPLSRSDINFIIQLVSDSASIGLPVESITMPPGAYGLNIRYQSLPYYVKYNLLVEGRGQLGVLLAVKHRLEQQHSVPTEYIDVRVEGRAFYR